MNSLSMQDCRNIILAMAAAIDDQRDTLSALDAATGDGDHGHNLAGAFQLAVAHANDPALETPSALFKKVGSTLINEMGGASGIIFGSFFAGGGRGIANHEALTLAEVALFFERGAAKVQQRGKAKLGDKTMLDALLPAVEALAAAHGSEQSLAVSLSHAADAAEAGAKQTEALVAQHGRAKFLGERSLGHQDAGAASMALLIRAWSDVGNRT